MARTFIRSQTGKNKGAQLIVTNYPKYYPLWDHARNDVEAQFSDRFDQVLVGEQLRRILLKSSVCLRGTI
jgi:hypothetical protein